LASIAANAAASASFTRALALKLGATLETGCVENMLSFSNAFIDGSFFTPDPNMDNTTAVPGAPPGTALVEARSNPLPTYHTALKCAQCHQ
jgi:hypothetical protein